MMILCVRCNNHYDDTCQSKACAGVTGESHKKLGPKPVEEHIAMVRSARGKPPAPTPAPGPSRGATGDATPSEDQLPTDA